VTSPEPLSLAQGACLSLVATGHHHGWALVRELAPDGGVGRIWSLSRPLTYRTIDQLVDRGLLERAGTEPGSGPTRAVLAITPTGSQQAIVWATTPVSHLREARTDLLVKLELGLRLGVDRVAFLQAQRVTFAPIIESIASRVETDLVDVWRAESSASVERFLARALAFVEAVDGSR
jgi:DNA-binding PadR family transcriptional regulator